MTMTSKTLNLRYKPVSQELLTSHQAVEKLWIGPSHKMSPLQVVHLLPVNLQCLDWDMTDATTIDDDVLEALFQKKSLSHLCLRFRGDEGVIQLSKHLAAAAASTPLQSLDLRGNHISCIGATALASCLAGSSLLSLNLAYNRIDDAGMKALCAALGKTRLEYLNLSCNFFGQDGANSLAASLKTNCSLREVSLFCNHIPHASCVKLVQILERDNVTLHQIKLGGTLTDTFCNVRLAIEYLLKLNRSGRYKLRQDNLDHAEWMNVLSNASDVDVLLYFLSNKPQLVSS